MICFYLFPYASEPSRDFNKSELVSYDFIFFPGRKNVSLEPSIFFQELVKIVFDNSITLAMTSSNN